MLRRKQTTVPELCAPVFYFSWLPALRKDGEIPRCSTALLPYYPTLQWVGMGMKAGMEKPMSTLRRGAAGVSLLLLLLLLWLLLHGGILMAARVVWNWNSQRPMEY